MLGGGHEDGVELQVGVVEADAGADGAEDAEPEDGVDFELLGPFELQLGDGTEGEAEHEEVEDDADAEDGEEGGRVVVVGVDELALGVPGGGDGGAAEELGLGTSIAVCQRSSSCRERGQEVGRGTLTKNVPIIQAEMRKIMILHMTMKLVVMKIRL